jgi:hypothetical protein
MVPRMEIRGWRQLETAASPKSSAQSMFAELQLQLITLIISSTILRFYSSHGVLITDVAISGCYIPPTKSFSRTGSRQSVRVT